MKRFALFKTPLGWSAIVTGDAGIERIALPRRSKRKLLREILVQFPDAVHNPIALRGEARQIKEYLVGKIRALDLPLNLKRLSPFQRQVYLLTHTIPYGQMRSYAWVARTLGRPKAARAVGRALARNPFPLAIPCHRVVRSDGDLGGFSGGRWLKGTLLKLERGAIR